jgi:hypothetical protein
VKVVDGQVATLELVPRDFTGDWYFDFASGPGSDRAILPTTGQTCGLIPFGEFIVESPK